MSIERAGSLFFAIAAVMWGINQLAPFEGDYGWFTIVKVVGAGIVAVFALVMFFVEKD